MFYIYCFVLYIVSYHCVCQKEPQMNLWREVKLSQVGDTQESVTNVSAHADPQIHACISILDKDTEAVAKI